jgi:hypothetical protein
MPRYGNETKKCTKMYKSVFFFHFQSRTVHLDIIKVLLLTNAHFF